MRISSTCQICDTSILPKNVVEHAQTHRGTVRVVIAGPPRTPRRRRTRRNRKFRFYLPAAGGGLGGVAGFLLFGTLLIALVCGVLAFVGMRRMLSAI